MTDTKISQLTDGGSLQSGDLIPIARGGANYAISGSKISGSPFCAGGTFDYADADGSLVFADLQGCTVARVGAGIYTITFDTPMPDANYGVLATGKWDGNNAQHSAPGIGLDREVNSLPTVNGFTLVSASGLYECRVSFVVFKSAAALLGLS